jgi:hypothetical protein
MKSQKTNKTKKAKKAKKVLTLAGAATAALGVINAFGGTSTNTVGPVQQGQSDGGTGNPALNNPAVTISFSGGTQLRGFITSQGISELSPGTDGSTPASTFYLHDGTSGAPIQYIAPNDPATFVQLANPNITSADLNPGTPAAPSTNGLQIQSAFRLEWKDQGSIDGLIDLVNDEVGFVQTSQGGNGPISNNAARGPSSANPVWINTNKFTANGTQNGFTLGGPTTGLGNTYNAALYNQVTGTNIQGGQNRIQFSVGEFSTEDLSVSGTPSAFAAPGTAGYGLGNPALALAPNNISGLQVASSRQQLQPATIVNESTNKTDPNTGANYAAGPWNTAGTNNLTTTPVAAAALAFVANPGTGLLRVDKGDAQWLQLTGRLQNGALFNVVQRSAGAGQRVVGAASYGIDPSWAVGTNDDGNTTTTAQAGAQHSIGNSLRFSGKTSDTEVLNTVSQSRMGVAADLSLAQARSAKGTAPIRTLDVYFNGLTDPTTGGGGTDDSQFAHINFDSLVSSDPTTRWQAVVTTHVVTVKSPDQTALNNELTLEGINPATATAAQQQTAWANVNTFDPATAEADATPASAPISGIKGDNHGDVAAFLSNIVNSVGSAAAGLTSTTVNNPADSLFVNGFVVPGLLDWTRNATYDTITPVTLNSQQLAEQAQIKANYGTGPNSVFDADSTFGSTNQTIGSGAFYGAGNTGGPAINGNIAITAKDSSGNPVANQTLAPGGNYLFGNFNQNGVRDFSAVEQAVNAALSLSAIDGALGGKNSIFTADGGPANSTVVSSLVGTPGWVNTGTNTKGDLIALGDFNGDGKFDGQDLYLLATGAALADNTTSTTLSATVSTFSDVIRQPNVVLRKNAALDYIQTTLASTTATAAAQYLLQSGRAVLAGSTVPGGAMDLHSTDPITGLEQFTYDPNGTNSFNKRTL